jgi:hypothetical protein
MTAVLATVRDTQKEVRILVSASDRLHVNMLIDMSYRNLWWQQPELRRWY